MRRLELSHLVSYTPAVELITDLTLPQQPTMAVAPSDEKVSKGSVGEQL